MGKRLIFGICSCGQAFYDAVSMNYHRIDGRIHRWVDVPDIRITKEVEAVKRTLVRKRRYKKIAELQ